MIHPQNWVWCLPCRLFLKLILRGLALSEAEPGCLSCGMTLRDIALNQGSPAGPQASPGFLAGGQLAPFSWPWPAPMRDLAVPATLNAVALGAEAPAACLRSQRGS